MFKSFPQCNFSLEFPEILSQSLICYHWLSLYGNSVTMHCGLLIKMPHCKLYKQKRQLSTYQTDEIFLESQPLTCILLNISDITYRINAINIQIIIFGEQFFHSSYVACNYNIKMLWTASKFIIKQYNQAILQFQLNPLSVQNVAQMTLRGGQRWYQDSWSIKRCFLQSLIIQYHYIETFLRATIIIWPRVWHIESKQSTKHWKVLPHHLYKVWNRNVKNS